MVDCLALVAKSLHHCLKNKQLKFNGNDTAKGAFSNMHSYFETLGKYLLFTKYLTSTNMPTCSAEKRALPQPRKERLYSMLQLNHFECVIS